MEEVVGIVFDFARSGLVKRRQDNQRCEWLCAVKGEHKEQGWEGKQGSLFSTHEPGQLGILTSGDDLCLCLVCDK